jgi:hypothetical protein
LKPKVVPNALIYNVLAGDWKITATFMGSNSYGSSWAETHATVVETQPSITSTPSSTQLNVDYTMAIVTSAIAIIIVVAIVGAIILVAVRKK